MGGGGGGGGGYKKEFCEESDEPMETEYPAASCSIILPSLEEHIASSHGQLTDVTPTPFPFL